MFELQGLYVIIVLYTYFSGNLIGNEYIYLDINQAIYTHIYIYMIYIYIYIYIYITIVNNYNELLVITEPCIHVCVHIIAHATVMLQ